MEAKALQVQLPYGQDYRVMDVPESATILMPQNIPGLADERAAVIDSLRHPIGCRPLRDIIGPHQHVAIVTADITRPMPNERVLPWLLEEIHAAGVPASHVVLINGTGSHRANTPEELIQMYGHAITSQYRIVNHDAFDPQGLIDLGPVKTGAHVWLNRDFVDADVKIVTGFIEPHFFAGFSGGPKGVFPALAGIQSIMHFHSAAMIGHPLATWGQVEGNPLQEEARAVWDVVRPDFLLNVTLNEARQITGVFSGRMEDAFAQGTAFVQSSAMIPVDTLFDIVVTSNNGYPLDQNLYQAVKGMSAAREIVRPGGLIVQVAECREGLPEHGHFKDILRMRSTAQELLDLIQSPDFHVYDQWEAQKLATILMHARVVLISSMDDATVRGALLEPQPSIEAALASAWREYGPDARLAILPQGPLSVPYVRQSEPAAF